LIAFCPGVLVREACAAAGHVAPGYALVDSRVCPSSPDAAAGVIRRRRYGEGLKDVPELSKPPSK